MPEGQDATAPPAPPPADEATPSGDLGITVALDQFNGPMDLLLYLVRRAEVDIKDLPVTTIADQFASWVAAAAGTTLDLEAAGDFVVMAATLLEIKARLVAPPPEGTEVADDGEDDFDPRSGLIRKLLIYRAAKEAAFDLDRRDDQRRLRHHRGHREVVPDDAAEVDAWELKDVGAGTLANLWFDLLKRIDGLGPRTVLVDDVPMGVRMAQMVEDMRGRGEGRLSELFTIDSGPVARVGIVMAVLECTRQRLLRVGQTEQYGDVLIRFRPEDDRAIAVGDPGPPDQLPKRQRRPPLVTWDGVVAPESDETEQAEEPTVENEEQRFLRDLESSVGVERLLARAANLEKGFIDWWEETHPGEALPPGVVRPEPPPPPPPPEPKAEAPAKPKRQPKAPAPGAPSSSSAETPPAAAETATPAAVKPQPAPGVLIPDALPPVAAPVSPPAELRQGAPGDAEPALIPAIPDPAPLAAAMPASPPAELELGAPRDAAPLAAVPPLDPQPPIASGPSFEVVPLPEAPPQPEAGVPEEAPISDGEDADVTEPPAPAAVVAEPALPLAEATPPASVELAVEAAAEPLAEAQPPGEPPPDPLPPPPETANTPAIPATTPSLPSKPTPMTRPRHLKTAALAALWALSSLALVAWFQRPGQVLTVSGPDDVVVSREDALVWTLNLALDPKDRESWLLPTASQPGTFAWRDARTCVFTPAAALPPGAAVAVAFPAKLRAYGGFSFDEQAVPAFTVRTLPALTVADPVASAPAFGETSIDLILNRVPADATALCAAVAVSPALPLTKAVIDGRLRLCGAFVTGTAYTVTVGDPGSGRADDRPSAWQGTVVIPARTPGARLAAGVGRQATIEAVNLALVVVENAAGARDIVRFAPGSGEQPARAELPAWLLSAGENRLRLRWAGGTGEIVVLRHDLRLGPDDGAPALLGGTLPVVSVR